MLVALFLLASDRPRLRWLAIFTGAAVGTALVVWLYSRSRLEGMELYQPGNILPPLGVVLVLDKLASLTLGLLAVLHLVALALMWNRGIDRHRPLLVVMQHLALAGTSGSVLAGDLVSLFLCWSLALVGFAGLAPGFRLTACAGIGAGLVALAVASGGPFVFADMAEQGIGGFGLALLALVLWLTGFWAMLTGSPNGTALWMAATAIIGRFWTLVPVGPWFMSIALGLALGVAASLTIARRRHGAPVPVASLLTGLVGILALYLFSQGAVWSTLAAIKLIVVLAVLAVVLPVALFLANVPVPLRRKATLVFGLCIALPIGFAAVIPGAFSAISTKQIIAVARQLHQPALYTVAVMGFPDHPMLAP